MSQSFLELFARNRTSQNAAVVCGDASLTYEELYKRSARLASRLRREGIGVCPTTPESYDIFAPSDTKYSPWVIIISERSVDVVTGIIATFMAGGAYVMTGADASEDYINGILDDTAANVVLRNGDFDAQEEQEFAFTFPKEDEIACAVFTSGSTGKPKGTVLEHRTLNEHISWQTEYMKPESWSAAAAYAPFSFIAAISEIFMPLANGLTLHILDENTRHDLFVLDNYIEKNNISHIFLPPNIAEVFTKTYKGNSLKYLRVAGGPLKSCGEPGGRYVILYGLGMSEAGGFVAFNPIQEAMNGPIPIGKNFGKTRVYLVGEEGEMAVSGPSLFRGYLSRGEETLKKLVKNPYSDEPGYEKIFLSGDLARTNENDEFIHMGRNDWIVKIRDMKVNPMQVESELGKCGGVIECCVAPRIIDGENVLIGWVVGDTDALTLKTELSSRIPEHMLPSVFVQLEKLPRSINGKIDRNALVYDSTPINTDGSLIPTEDMSSNEAKIAVLFRRVLWSLPQAVNLDDNFFMLGGNSLKLMQLQAEIAKHSYNIPYSVLFANPTPRMLASVLGGYMEAGGHIPAAAPMQAYPLSAPMRQMWLMWRTGRDCGKYTVSIQCRFTGEIDKPRVKAAFEELVRRNEVLRSRFEERGEVFQIIEDCPEFYIAEEPRNEFDLTKTPIFDVSIKDNVLCFTTHHIISDAIGLRVLMEDFWTLYSGGEPQKSAQAHDVTMWSQNRDGVAEEGFWLQMYGGGVPVLELPYDYARPKRLNASAIESVYFDGNEAKELFEYASSHNSTLFQLFLTAFAMLLSELSGGGDVVVGVPFSGREHPDTARSVGMLVRTLPVKLDIFGEDFGNALDYTRNRFMEVWEHQEISLERLTEIIDVPRSVSRNPFYDAMINYIPLPRPLPDVCGLCPEILRGGYPGALFDLVLDLREETEGVSAVFTYATELFKPETVRGWANAFKRLLLTRETDFGYEHNQAYVYEVKCEAAEALQEFDENLPQVRELVEAWEKALELESVSPCDDFYLAGGTSLAAIRIEAALYARGWLLSAPDILQNPRLSDMAALMTPADEIDWDD